MKKISLSRSIERVKRFRLILYLCRPCSRFKCSSSHSTYSYAKMYSSTDDIHIILSKLMIYSSSVSTYSFLFVYIIHIFIFTYSHILFTYSHILFTYSDSHIQIHIFIFTYSSSHILFTYSSSHILFTYSSSHILFTYTDIRTRSGTWYVCTTVPARYYSFRPAPGDS